MHERFPEKMEEAEGELGPSSVTPLGTWQGNLETSFKEPPHPWVSGPVTETCHPSSRLLSQGSLESERTSDEQPQGKEELAHVCRRGQLPSSGNFADNMRVEHDVTGTLVWPAQCGIQGSGSLHPV